jgi:glucosamine-6-phosphate deaminase
MQKLIYKTAEETAKAAADAAAEAVKKTIEGSGGANIVLATGTSQIEMLKNLTAGDGVDWSKVTMFHLDEYIGLGGPCR